MAHTARTVPTPRFNDTELATLCCGGQLDYGVELCKRRRARGETTSIGVLVALVSPRTHRVSVTGFDCLADALDRYAMWCEAEEGRF